MMNHLIVYAHPSKNSFGQKLVDALVDQGQAQGWEVVVRDLYALGFNPVLSAADLEALHQGITPDEILEEQAYISQADLVTVIYPLWWAGFPAILKGYIDRVLSWGFAYTVQDGAIKGLLAGKKVFVLTTLGNNLSNYEANNLLTAFQTIHRDEIFGFCGMELVAHRFFEKVTTADHLLMAQYINEVLELYPHEVGAGAAL